MERLRTLLSDAARAPRRAHAADPRLFRVRAALAALLFTLLVWLIVEGFPWRQGVSERLAEHKPVRTIDWLRTYGWWAGAGNALLLAALLASARRWLGPSRVPACAALAPPGRAPLWFAPLVASAMAACALLAWPRLGMGFAPDEETTLVRYIDGRYQYDERGLRRVGVSWDETFWNARTPNNHVPLSILSRLSLAIWRDLAGPQLEFADERVVRLPAFLAGVASVGATALLARRLGFAAAGVVAAWLLALHPWHMRYASEARGYALVLLLAPLTWICLLAALRGGGWRRWLGYGLAQCALLWSHAGAFWLLAVTNAVAALGVWRLHARTPRLREQAARLGVTGALAAGVYLQLMLPGLVQILAYLRQWQGDTRGFAGPVLRDALAHLAAGVAWRQKRGAEYLELSDLEGAEPILFAVAVAVLVTALAAGAVRLARARGAAALLLPALLLPGPLVYASAWLRQDRFYPFYLVLALPGLAVLAAAGLTWPAEVLPTAQVRAALRVALPVTGLLLLAWLGGPSREVLRSRPIDPSRDSVQVARRTLNPFSRKGRSRIVAYVYRPALYYDPAGVEVRHVEALQKLMARADQRKVPLYVNQARPGLAARRTPELASFVARDDLFETVARFPGWEPENERVLRRYRGAAARAAP